MANKLIHLDLFSGIGGFSLASDTVWGGANMEHVFCDNNKFCKAVLKKHWPESDNYDDIKTITADTYGAGLEKAGTEQQAAGGRRGNPFILTGGFPCQPFSAAGLRRGTADERHLWPEMLRVIRLTQPEWVIAENVRGLTNWNDGVVFEEVCSDLEASGYEVWPFIIPALAVNAPHRRDRIWFVAHAKGIPGRGGKSGEDNQAASQVQKRNQVGEPAKPDKVRATTDTSDGGRQGGGQKAPAQERYSAGSESARQLPDGSERPDSDVTDADGRQSRSGDVSQPVKAEQFQRGADDRTSWGRDWFEVAAELCRVDDGLPARVDGLELTKSQHRAEQLKAYGNAIVPQVAMRIMMAIKEGYDG